MARYSFLALTVGPHVVFTAGTQEAPTELAERLLEIAELHAGKSTPIRVHLFRSGAVQLRVAADERPFAGPAAEPPGSARAHGVTAAA